MGCCGGGGQSQKGKVQGWKVEQVYAVGAWERLHFSQQRFWMETVWLTQVCPMILIQALCRCCPCAFFATWRETATLNRT